MAGGYTRDLLILPFDHRASFAKVMFGAYAKPSPAITQAVAAFKDIVYDAYLRALSEKYVSKETSGVLVDEEFGDRVLKDCRASGRIFAVCAEKSGQDEFDFEYGTRFGQHIEKYHPTFTKVLVRYNPDSHQEMNERQNKRLRKLGDYLRKKEMFYLFELLVPPTKEQKQLPDYDTKVRPDLMVRAILEIQEAGVYPDVWKIEGLESRADVERVAAACRKQVKGAGIIILGRGESDEKVGLWLRAGAKVPGVIGFAVGRTVFQKPLEEFRDRKLSRVATVKAISENYRQFVEIWNSARN
ncbi:MAG: DUF2090 domain-containing protein [Planctomycetes bacterium]|nr:DUF2090 domain-containing protein [Planctomycetota bacterium]